MNSIFLLKEACRDKSSIKRVKGRYFQLPTSTANKGPFDGS